MIALRCEALAAVAAARMRERWGVSDADESIAAAMHVNADPWPEAAVLDTNAPREVAALQAALVRPQPAEPPWIPRRSYLLPD
jgi:predicted kinase